MDPVRNPYSPGAGLLPPALVGRDDLLEAMDITLQRLLLQRDGRSQLLIGLRGVGKTVLLNQFGRLAETRGYFHQHLEVAEDGTFLPALVAAARRALLAMEARHHINDGTQHALGVLKAFSLLLPERPGINIDVDAIPGPADSGDLASDLAGLFTELGQLARDQQTGVLFTIDELHYIDLPALTALMAGLRRPAQLRLPMMVAGAGLPGLSPITGDIKSDVEQLFSFPHIGSLSPDLAAEALAAPAHDDGVEWTPDALDHALAVTHCYPYFMQTFGKVAWDVAPGPHRITQSDVERAIPLATAALDDGFFRTRASRTSPKERSYLRAMAELGPGPVRSKDVATLMGTSTNALATTRDALIKRAICYSPRRGEIDFTAPLFGEFMQRWMPSPSTPGPMRGNGT